MMKFLQQIREQNNQIQSTQTNLTKVYLREEEKFVQVAITNKEKPQLDKFITEKWQKIINLAAKIINVPAGLIMKITEDSMTVFLKSTNNENPYPDGGNDKLGHGLYCETVIGKDVPLSMDNALTDEKWKDNPDVKLDMISYYGVPIKWPDDEFFGTICVLDNKENSYSDLYKELMADIKLTLEDDLKLLLYRQELQYFAEMDILTGVYNRRKTEDLVKTIYSKSNIEKETFSLVMIDINKFKKINDNFGHQTGDEMLKIFARTVRSRIRKTDIIGRWGGDEFIIVCPRTDALGCEKVIFDITEPVIKEMNKLVPNSGFCYGISEYSKEDKSYQDIIKRADDRLYICKDMQYKK